MKSDIKILGLLLVIFLLRVTFPIQASGQQPYVSFQVFYDQLSPYGEWVDYQNYGYVWIPDAGPDFFPYSSGGHWIMTEYGWTWVSDYDWGWAPFHYGRWDYDNNFGWFWIPDNEWGPAWVTWRRSEGYYGWSPMGPGISISMSFGNNRDYYSNRWIFVNDRYFGRDDFHRYYANRNDYDRIYRSSNIINNTYVDNSRRTKYISGPARVDVQRVTGRNVSSYAFRENNVPGQNLRKGEFRTYRPQIVSNNNNEHRPVPTRVTNLQEVRKPSERNSDNLQRANPGRVQQQNTMNRQNAANKQRAADQQNATNRQNAANARREQQQNNVNKQNAENQQNAVNRRNAENQQNARNRQNAEKQQNATNRQNAEKQQNAVNAQNARNNERAVQQQNKKINNEQKAQKANDVKAARAQKAEQSKKTKSNPEKNKN